MWRANGNPTPCTDLDEILDTHSFLSKEGFNACLTRPPPPIPGPGGPETLKQRCSADCILTQAALGTSASNI